MRIKPLPNPNTKAEGTCNGLAYDTQLVNIDGVNIHFWVGDGKGIFKPHTKLTDALHKARCARDIVSATWSFGAPTGFWTHQDIE